MNFTKIFWSIFFGLFIIYISIFMASKSGYYEYENKTKKVLTEEKMKEFENDVKKGKNIDLKNYFKNEDINYENKITNVGSKFSSFINAFVNEGLETSFKVMEKLFN